MESANAAGPEYSSDAIWCTIDNQTSGAIQYNQSSTTGGVLNIEVDTLPAGSSQKAFSAKGASGLPSGCGGRVVYNLPNGQDQLVVVYNVSYSGHSAEIYTELQNQNHQRPGCDAYFVVVTNGSTNGTSLKPVVTVYQAGASATPQTDYVPTGGNMRLTIANQLDTWLTLNNFPNTHWDTSQMMSNATSSIAPGDSQLVLDYGSAYKFTLTYNITSEYLLTITLDKGDKPTAGFNASSPYTATVTGKEVATSPFPTYAYTVTVSPLSAFEEREG